MLPLPTSLPHTREGHGPGEGGWCPPQVLNGGQDTRRPDPGGLHTTGLPRCLEDWTEQEMLSVCPWGQAHLEEESSFQEQRRRGLIERDQELLNLNSSSVKWE